MRGARRPRRAPARRWRFHAGDVRDAGGARRASSPTVAPDAVVHLAGARVVPARRRRDPRAAYRVNLGGTLALLAARARRARRGARSWSSARATSTARSSRRELPRRRGRRRSARSRSTARARRRPTWRRCSGARAYGLDVVRARPFNHTGPGQGAAFVCAALARQVAAIEAGRQPPVLRVGNLDPVRDFSDVRDVAAGYVALLERGRRGHGLQPLLRRGRERRRGHRACCARWRACRCGSRSDPARAPRRRRRRASSAATRAPRATRAGRRASRSTDTLAARARRLARRRVAARGADRRCRRCASLAAPGRARGYALRVGHGAPAPHASSSCSSSRGASAPRTCAR